MPIVELLILLVVVAIVFFILQRLLPMLGVPAQFIPIIFAIIGLMVPLWVLSQYGLLPTGIK
jgi:hypothetical protein